MPNNIGGKGFKKGKKKGNNFREQKELILRDPKENENYGLVKGAKGNGRFDIETPDGTTKMGILAGKHRKRMWINAGDIVLLGVWEFQEGKCSIIHKYSEDHVQKLIEKKEILHTFQKDKFSQFSDHDHDVDYFSTDLPHEEDSEESEKEESSDEEIDINDI
jgi:translation initiation factor 1A